METRFPKDWLALLGEAVEEIRQAGTHDPCWEGRAGVELAIRLVLRHAPEFEPATTKAVTGQFRQWLKSNLSRAMKAELTRSRVRVDPARAGRHGDMNQVDHIRLGRLASSLGISDRVAHERSAIVQGARQFFERLQAYILETEARPRSEHDRWEPAAVLFAEAMRRMANSVMDADGFSAISPWEALICLSGANFDSAQGQADTIDDPWVDSGQSARPLRNAHSTLELMLRAARHPLRQRNRLRGGEAATMALTAASAEACRFVDIDTFVTFLGRLPAFDGVGLKADAWRQACKRSLDAVDGVKDESPTIKDLSQQAAPWWNDKRYFDAPWTMKGAADLDPAESPGAEAEAPDSGINW